MSLTRSALLQKTKLRYSEVEVEGIGTIGIRSITQLQLSRRYSSYNDKDGKFIPSEGVKAGVHKIIDQVCEAPGKPMFTDADFDEVAGMAADTVDALHAAIDEFNGDQKKATNE